MDYDEEEKRWLQSMKRYEEEGRHDEGEDLTNLDDFQLIYV